MTADRNPQAEQMADESMVRNLAAQAECIWPAERLLFERYGLSGSIAVLDVACGTGEITDRLADLFPSARLLGVDLLEAHLERARTRAARHGERVRFEVGDAYHLDGGAEWDLVVCRHVLQAIPHFEQVVAELVRVTRPGGVVHIVAEDYAMMHFHPTTVDADLFWHRGPIPFAASSGTDLRSGRKIFSELRRLGLEDTHVDWISIDTTRCPREPFAEIWTAWRDGYARVIAEHTEFSYEEVLRYFDEMIAAIRNPDGFGVWHLPVTSGRKPR